MQILAQSPEHVEHIEAIEYWAHTRLRDAVATGDPSVVENAMHLLAAVDVLALAADRVAH